MANTHLGDKCDRCGRSDRPVTHEVARSKLLFGGFHGKMFEYRCAECEQAVIKWVEGFLTKDAKSRFYKEGSD